MNEGDQPQPNSAPEDVAGTEETTPQAATSSATEGEPATDSGSPLSPSMTSAPDANSPVPETPPSATPEAKNSDSKPAAKIGRSSGPLAARGLGVAKPASPQVSTDDLESGKPDGKSGKGKPAKKKSPRPRLGGESTDKPGVAKPVRPQTASKVAVPNRRASLPDDIQAELDAQLASADVESMLGGAAGMPDRAEPLSDGDRVHGQVLKIHDDNVFIGLGGPDEGYLPFEQFETEPAIGDSIEVILRGINSEDGLYILSLPGGAVEVSDWEDLEEGSVVEATVTGHNAGGLECKVGGVRGFIPISQVTEYRVEDLSEFADQKMLCVVTEASASRGNLVLSRRAILEREREEKRQEQLEKIQVGDLIEGTVRSIKDFGAFVDLGGLDGLIHISKLSWDRVKHPSEVLEEGQKVQVKIEKIDKDSAKIGLSYRDLLENPWDTAEADFSIGTVHQGTVTRIANFGCFVKLAAGVEGLVHISELAHHRVSKVDTMVSEGQDVEVKVLSFDRDSQKIGLSIKAAQAAPVDTSKKADDDQPDEPAREPAVKASHDGPLKGGNNRETGGERFGLRW